MALTALKKEMRTKQANREVQNERERENVQPNKVSILDIAQM